MDSYDEIVKRMNDKFTELAGYSPDSASDIGIRIKVLAGEIYSVSSAVEWLKRQTFAQTATGSELEQRAQERGITRKPPVAAYGKLTFSITESLWFPALIPAGTICSTSGNYPVRYVVTQDTYLPQGDLSVDVPAKAETAGIAGNTEAFTVQVMVTPPGSIEGVINNAAFKGGEDSESDESLRARLLESYAEVSNGTNAAWYRKTALKYDGVHSAGVIPRSGGTGKVAVYLGGRGCVPPDETVQKVRSDMNSKKEIDVDVTVAAAQTVSVDVTAAATAKSGLDTSEVRTACKNAIQEYFYDLGVGAPVILSAIGAKLFSTGMITDCSFSTAGKAVSNSQLAVAGTISVTVTAGG